MSIADLYDISRAVRRDKAREQGLLPIPSSLVSVSASTCNICYKQSARYNCPACNIPYCSLVCFRARVHQSCSETFSTATLRNQVRTNKEPLIEAVDREKVFDILQRVETQNVEQRQQALDDSDDASDDDDDESELSSPPVDVDADLDSASVEQLLQMLSPKQRQAFEKATKSTATAQKLMDRLERKAERLNLDPTTTTKATDDTASPAGLIRTITGDKKRAAGTDLIANAMSGSNSTVRPESQRRSWQSQPWFQSQVDGPDMYAKSSISHVSHDAFAAELRKLLGASGSANKALDLTFNLAAVLMTYTYILRHFDVSALVMLELETFHEAYNIIDRLVPFLTQSVMLAAQTALTHDHSKTILTDLDDALLWLLLRLSYETELGTNADELRLQLLTDLQMLTRQTKIIAISEEFPAAHHAIAAQLGDEMHSFTASQHALVLHALADLYTFFDKVQHAADGATSRGLSRSAKAAERKVCFYAINTLFNAPASSYTQLPSMLTQTISNVQQDIEQSQRLDKVALANKLAEGELHSDR